MAEGNKWFAPKFCQVALVFMVRFMHLFSCDLVVKSEAQEELKRFISVFALLNYFWLKDSAVEINAVISISDFYTYSF